MSLTILVTKLYIPPPRTKIVLRPRLIEQLNEGLRSGHRLFIISAAAGFGKTATALEKERFDLVAMEEEWLELEMLREEIEG